MPRLTEVMETGATNAPDSACPRCSHRVPAVNLRVMLRTRQVGSVESKRQGGKSLREVTGPMLCRTCGNEVLDQVAQLLGVEG